MLLTQSLIPSDVDHVLHLYCRQFECLVRIHSVFTFDEVWVQRVKTYLSLDVTELDNDGQTPLPKAWQECVTLARLCLEILLKKRPTEYIIL